MGMLSAFSQLNVYGLNDFLLLQRAVSFAVPCRLQQKAKISLTCWNVAAGCPTGPSETPAGAPPSASTSVSTLGGGDQLQQFLRIVQPLDI